MEMFHQTKQMINDIPEKLMQWTTLIYTTFQHPHTTHNFVLLSDYYNTSNIVLT